MFKGFYTAATGMIAQQRRTEMLSNNISNTNTAGYKADQSTIRSFPDMLMSSVQKQDPTSVLPGGTMQEVGGISTGVYMQETLPNFGQGTLLETENDTDVALIDAFMPLNEETGKPGSIFFKVQSENDLQAYTRNGTLAVDGEGFLTTAEGYYILDENDEPIEVQNQKMQIGSDGMISLDGENTTRIGVAYSDNPDTLSKRENGLYYTVDEANLENAYDNEEVNFSMQQGFMEGSNVDAAQTMTAMTEAYRVFEANQKVLQAYDRSMEKAVNEIGRV